MRSRFKDRCWKKHGCRKPDPKLSSTRYWFSSETRCSKHHYWFIQCFYSIWFIQ